ncbi:acyltransferase [Pseudomonas sp. ABC1]|uniref:acyltransferase n=1 Tax=Pseudomonas sp. ABC1 TaxID=2748080 RepID=UPI0015C31B19|nr:acyltransferase [Pseudomonas sp. ABC1]QLF94496.1 acyltransferase [Pseudomonas sp. ABC1]
MKNIVAELRYQIRYGLPIWFFTLITSWLPDVGPVMKFRGGLISIFLPGFPKRLSLARDVTFLAANKIIIGKDVFIAKGVWVNGIGGVSFGDEVVIAPYVVMSSNNHGFKDGSVRFGGGHPAPIVIGKGSWVAAHAVVAAGVTIGEGNLIAANSVVVRDTAKNSVIAGVPGKLVKERLDNPSHIINKHQAG